MASDDAARTCQSYSAWGPDVENIVAIVSIQLWSTAVAKVGKYWIVQSDSTVVTLSIDDSNNDGIIDSAEWDAFTTGGGGGLDKGSPDALYDGTTGTSGVIYSSTEYSEGENVTSVLKSLGNTFQAAAEDLGDVVCFCRGTMINTDLGEVAIENLRTGDMVETLDCGYLPIRWIGSSLTVGTGKNAPIRFRKNALGNKQDLWLSPQHRVLLSDWRAELMFGSTEVIVTAKSLINDTTIQKVESGVVEYFHILLDSHELIFAEGIPAETLFLSEISMGVLGGSAQDEILELFPSISGYGVGKRGFTTRPVLKNYEVTAITAN
jgi:hypothetical protein